jgi:membrane protein YqaA with SNARE-associated domain
MHWFPRSFIGFFATPVGVMVLAAADSTLFFSLPFGIDTAVIILAARLHRLAWTVPLLAAGSSLAGAALTFWMGVKIGEQGLDRYVSPRRLKRIRNRVRNRGAIALAALDLIPPPFPFTLLVLSAGALETKPSTFFFMLFACRLLRFGGETLLALIYGRRIIGWFDSEIFHKSVTVCLLLAGALTVLSIVRFVGAMRRHRPVRA